jgi:hypothetical protein
MSPEIEFDGIHEEFRSLATGSARESLSAGGEIISTASEEKQRELLENDFFCKALNSAPFNLDQRSSEARIKVVSSFHKKNQPLAFKTFVGRSN